MPNISRWQYQVKAEGRPPVVPFSWYQQPSEPIRFKERRPEGGLVQPLFPPPPAVPDIFPDSWYQQPNEPVRVQARSQPFLVEIPQQIVANFDWFKQQPEPLPQPRRPEGRVVRGFVDNEITPDFDWFQQQADVIRRRHQVDEGLFTSPQEAELIEVDLDWFVQHLERSPRKRHQTEEGIVVRGYDATEITPDFDWFQQHPEPLPKPARPIGLIVRGYDDQEIQPNVGRFQQLPDILQQFRRPVGYFALVEFEIPVVAVTTDWIVQHPEPVIKPQRPAGHFSLVEFSIPSFGWYHQPFEVPKTRQPLVNEFSVVGVPPIIPSFDWYRQPVERPRTILPLVPEGTSVLGAIPIVPSFEWFIQNPEIVVRRQHQVDEGKYVLVEFSVPIPP